MSVFAPMTKSATGADPPSSALLSFGWDPKKGETILAQFGKLSTDSNVNAVLASDDLRQGLITALFHAEQLAADAGFSSAIPTEKGPGYIIGAGYTKAKQNPSHPAAAAYLSLSDAVAQALDTSKAAPADATPTIGSSTQTLGPVALIAILVIGIGALTAAAYVGTQWVQAHEDSLARVARVKEAADLVRRGLPVPPGMIPNEPEREKESGDNTIKYLGYAALAVGAGVLLIGLRK